jgi:hypothetical protein
LWSKAINGDPVSVARQIGEDRLGPTERRLCVDHPLELAQRREIGRKGALLGQPGMFAEELEIGRKGAVVGQPGMFAEEL